MNPGQEPETYAMYRSDESLLYFKQHNGGVNGLVGFCHRR